MKHFLMSVYVLLALSIFGLVQRAMGEQVRDHRACTVRLISPMNNALLSQRRVGRDKVENAWRFSWSECSGAAQYHLYVIGPNAVNPIVNNSNLRGTSYVERSTHYGITALEGWTWKVRANVNGTWGEWSDTRIFNVSPVIDQ